jgi:OOP family OmpA-OmpF porin
MLDSFCPKHLAYRKSAAAAFVLLGTMLASGAQAEGYGGISVGRTSASIDNTFLPITGATATTLSKDESSNGVKIFGGYRFKGNLAIEGGYVDLGKFKATRTATAPAAGTFHADIKSGGLYADALALLPLQDNFSVFAKAGPIITVTQTSYSSTGAVIIPGNTDAQHAEVNLKVGVGASWDFSKDFGMRVEYEFIKGAGDKTTGEADIGMFSIGFVKRF